MNDWDDTPTLVPPCSIEAEVCVIGSAILDDRCVGEAREIVTPEDFYRPAHQELWNALCWMVDHNVRTDLVTLKDTLLKHGRLAAVGGIEYAADIVEGVPNSANVAHYAKIVRDKSVLREAIHNCTGIIKDSYEAMVDPAELVQDASGRFFELGQRLVGQGRSMDVGTAADLVVERSKHAQETSESPGLPTGIAMFDGMVGGLRRNHLIVLAGKTGLGKSSMALCNWCVSVLVDGGWVVYVSVEMPSDDLTGRLMASLATVNLRKIEDGLLDAPEWDRVNVAREQIQNWRERLRIIGRPVPPSHAAVWCRALQGRFPNAPGLLVYDYVQRIPRSHPKQSQYECVSEGSTALKNLALDLNIPVVAVAQFNRGPEADNRLPRMSDLKASGDIEQDADVVFLLGEPRDPARGPGPDQPGDPDDPPWVEVWGQIAKGRRCPKTHWSRKTNTSDIQMRFYEEVTKFGSWE